MEHCWQFIVGSSKNSLSGQIMPTYNTGTPRLRSRQSWQWKYYWPSWSLTHTSGASHWEELGVWGKLAASESVWWMQSYIHPQPLNNENILPPCIDPYHLKEHQWRMGEGAVQSHYYGTWTMLQYHKGIVSHRLDNPTSHGLLAVASLSLGLQLRPRHCESTGH